MAGLVVRVGVGVMGVSLLNALDLLDLGRLLGLLNLGGFLNLESLLS